MENVKPLSQREILAEWWLEVKENFFFDTRKPVLRLIQILLANCFEGIRDEYVEVDYNRRSSIPVKTRVTAIIRGAGRPNLALLKRYGYPGVVRRAS